MNTENSECLICFSEKSDLILLTEKNFICFICGIVCCIECTSKLNKCPQCRRSIYMDLHSKIENFDNLLKRDNYGYLYFAQYIIGLTLFNNHQFKQALNWLDPSAMGGYNLAQYLLGYMALKGYGINKNISLAFKWFILASENKLVDAKVIIAFCHYKGIFLEKNTDLAQKYFLETANKNDVLSQNILAGIYNDKEEYKKAFKWYQRASESNCIRSLYMNALYYEHGFGCRRNRKKAFQIYKNLALNHAKKPFKTSSDMQINIMKEILIINSYPDVLTV